LTSRQKAIKAKQKRVSTTTRIKKNRPTNNLGLRTRSKFEDKTADLFAKHKVEVSYEDKSKRIEYTIPAKNSKYLPDFIVKCEKTGIEYFIETKGRFRDLQERQKYLLIQEQHPELKLVMCFMNPRLPITKGSKTTYKMFFDKHGIINCDFKQLEKVLANSKKTGKIDFTILD